MWNYEKRLQFPVNIKEPNAKLAQVIISQYGGPDGEMGASMRYLSQRYSMPYKEVAGLLTDIGTEEFVHSCCTLAFSIIFYIISYIFFTLNTISELFITLFHNFQSRSCCLEKVSVASHFTFPRINLRNFHLCL